MDDRALVNSLVAWYRREARTLPWRDDPTPYKVLLSELMLQQTRVETVLPYFARFLARWPHLEDLAAAHEEEVVEAWAGLGYYRRARHLHRCAREAVRLGGLPSEADALKALPGIGPYTAGAVASIAFGQRVPLVDGNVERVLSRLDAATADPRSPAGRRALWRRAEGLHVACDAHPGDLNQALMELGATVCTPRSPSCAGCPVRPACRGAEQGIAETLPRKAPKKAPVPIAGVAGLLASGEELLLARRSPGGLLGGLFEPVRAELPAAGAGAGADGGAGAGEGTSVEEALIAAFAEVGLRVAVGPRLGEVVHVFTHRRLTCAVYAVYRLDGAPRPGGPYDEVRLTAPGAVGLSTLARKLLAVGSDAPDPRQPALPLAADAE